jgi:MYXO-CTERM domain-containing protein
MKLAPLFALAFVAIVVSCSASESIGPETLGRQRQGQTCTCPGEAETGSCGKWTCLISRSGNICTFEATASEGEKCVLGPADTLGLCFSPTGDPKQLICCPGCVTPPSPLGGIDGKCHVGDEHGYCGGLGDKCDACGPCEACKEGRCVPTSGNACGTCKVCSEGSCQPEDAGAACPGGRCAEGAICCTGCIDGSDQCVSSTDRSCGLAGARCEDCGQCGSCSSGACQAKTSGTCDDGDPCTEDDTCGAGGCEGTEVAVDDGNECTDDACSAMDGITHTSMAEGSTCVGSGTSCVMGGWHCTDHDDVSGTPRVCQPVGGTICYDGDPCTSDTPDCTGMGSCPYPAVSDGEACTGGLRCVLNESCQGGECVGEARNCSDDNPCTTDSCEESDGADVDPVTGCKHAPKSVSTTCDDGNGCTDDDHCGADGNCDGTAKTCSPLDECHAPGSCDPGTGECTDPRLQDGTACESTGTCDGGQCVGGTDPGAGGSGGSSGGGGSSSGASGSPGAGEGNDAGTTSAAGSDNMPGTGGNGGKGGTGSTSGGAGGSGTGGDSAGTAGEGTPFKREPGGCSCRVGGTSAPARDYTGLVLLGGIALFARRRRRAA